MVTFPFDRETIGFPKQKVTNQNFIPEALDHDCLFGSAPCTPLFERSQRQISFIARTNRFRHVRIDGPV